MRHTRILLAATLVALTALASRAQAIWTSADASLAVTRALTLGVEADFRTHYNCKGIESLRGTFTADYKVLPWLKAHAGYTYLYQNTPMRRTSKGNYVSSFWQSRNRFFAGATAKVKAGRFEFSLRERYQLTHRGSMEVDKYDSDGDLKPQPELIGARTRHVLRSRLQAEWSPRKSPFKPYVNVEISNSLSSGFHLDKTRYTVGTDYKINRNMGLGLYYRYIDHSDDDDDSGHVIGLSYSLKFKL